MSIVRGRGVCFPDRAVQRWFQERTMVKKRMDDCQGFSQWPGQRLPNILHELTQNRADLEIFGQIA